MNSPLRTRACGVLVHGGREIGSERLAGGDLGAALEPARRRAAALDQALLGLQLRDELRFAGLLGAPLRGCALVLGLA